VPGASWSRVGQGRGREPCATFMLGDEVLIDPQQRDMQLQCMYAVVCDDTIYYRRLCCSDDGLVLRRDDCGGRTLRPESVRVIGRIIRRAGLID